MFESEEITDRPLEPIPGATPGIRFISTHHAGPLFRAHCSSAAVGQHVDENVLRAQQEHVESGLGQVLSALFARRHPDRLDYFDLERLYDRLRHLTMLIP